MIRWIIAILCVSVSTVGSQAQTHKDAQGTSVSAVANAGTYGTDYSANQPVIPAVGANFGASGPYANFVLLRTVQSNPQRLSIDVENTSGGSIVVVIDDGTAAAGAAPANASVFSLSGGSGAGSQGGSWLSTIERGRVQVYAPSSTAQVGIREN